MENDKTKPQDIDAYVGMFPEKVKAMLQSLWQAVREAAPDAEETISYQMPTLRLNGNLVHFAAHKEHIGFYPTPSAIEAFQEQLVRYETSKGAIRFPLDQPLPLGLIGEIVKFRVRENLAKEKTKK